MELHEVDFATALAVVRGVPDQRDLVLGFVVGVSDGRTFTVRFAVGSFFKSTDPFVRTGIAGLNEESLEALLSAFDVHWEGNKKGEIKRIMGRKLSIWQRISCGKRESITVMGWTFWSELGRKSHDRSPLLCNYNSDDAAGQIIARSHITDSGPWLFLDVICMIRSMMNPEHQHERNTITRAVAWMLWLVSSWRDFQRVLVGKGKRRCDVFRTAKESARERDET